MTYSVRHQVFVSSTFTDLVEERAEVIQAIWELDCIPTGMEAFVASNESQWSVIKRVIDECDYYVLIIGGRYGSVTEDGVSYTEKEYRYAKAVGLPVLAFVHGQPTDIPIGKSELDAQSREKLAKFRAEVMKDHPVRTWSSATELGGYVSRSLVREIRVSPRPGWIRNDGSSPISLLEQINRLTEENRQLAEQLNQQVADDPDDTDLESGVDEIEIWGTRRLQLNEFPYQQNADWHALITYDEIWREIGPALINESSEFELKAALGQLHHHDDVATNVTQIRSAQIATESWNELLIQFRALGYLTQGTKKRGINDRESYWAISPRGDRHLVALLARRKAPEPKLV